MRTLDIQPGGLVAREGRAVPKVMAEHLAADPLNDLFENCFCGAHQWPGRNIYGVCPGWGQKQGAVATTLCWDAGAIVGIGENDEDLACAVNHVIQIQGGTAVFLDGTLKVDVPLRAGGYVSELKMPELGDRLNRFQKIMASMGVIPDFAQLSLSVLTTPAIPFIRLTEKGIIASGKTILWG